MALALPANTLEAWYGRKPDGYFAGARADFVARLPRAPNARVLEVGCGAGTTGVLALATGRASHYAGVELFEPAAAAARKVLSEVVVGDVERLVLPWAPASFDVLILSEVLEHLIDPWAALARLAELVRPEGRVLASSPNVSHWRVIRELLAGRFEHSDRGVFDRTHLRWFTPATYRTMFERAGFAVDDVWALTARGPRSRLFSLATSGRFDHLIMTQICLEGIRR